MDHAVPLIDCTLQLECIVRISDGRQLSRAPRDPALYEDPEARGEFLQLSQPPPEQPHLHASDHALLLDQSAPAAMEPAFPSLRLPSGRAAQSTRISAAALDLMDGRACAVTLTNSIERRALKGTTQLYFAAWLRRA